MNRTTGTISTISAQISQECPGLIFALQENTNLGLLTIILDSGTKLGIGTFNHIHRVMRNIMPAGIDYEIETVQGTYTSRHTLKNETPIPVKRRKREKNRTRTAAPWKF